MLDPMGDPQALQSNRIEHAAVGRTQTRGFVTCPLEGRHRFDDDCPDLAERKIWFKFVGMSSRT